MRRIRNLVVITVLLLASLAPTLAQEQLVYSFQVLKVKELPSKKLIDVKDWRSFVKSGKVVVLEEVGGSTVTGKDTLVHAGAKYPLSYEDPKAGMYQVQYVDHGTKIDTIFKPLSEQRYLLEARGERAIPNPHPESKDRVLVTIFESTTVLKKGQVAIFGAARGPVIERLFKEQFPAGSLQSDDWIVMVLSLE